MAISVVWPWRSSKALPRAKLAPKKVLVTVWWSAACLYHYSFLYPNETIISEKYAQQIDEMHRNGNTCSWPWAIEWTKFFSMTMPNCMLHNHHFKIDQTGLQSFASSSIFTWPLVNRLPILQASRQLFAGKMLPQPAGYRKCFPRVRRILKNGFLYYSRKQTYFLLAKNV